MKNEIATAAKFICQLVEKALPPNELFKFREKLIELLFVKFLAHWNPSEPLKGSAYRSAMVTEGFVDPLFLLSAKHADVIFDSRWFPKDFIIWTDPGEVSYRIGDSGSVATVPLATQSRDVLPDVKPIHAASPVRGLGGGESEIVVPYLSKSRLPSNLPCKVILDGGRRREAPRRTDSSPAGVEVH